MVVGDTTVMLPPDKTKLSFISKIERIERCSVTGDIWLKVRWYYRPEEAKGGRKAFHGEKELFLSDHRDWVAEASIDGACVVHTLKEYVRLTPVKVWTEARGG